MPRTYKRFQRKSIRLPWWDYTTAGWYFVTVCTKQRECVLGVVVDEEVRLSAIGDIVAEEWKRTEHIRSNVLLDEWIVMPNHLHGILILQPSSQERSNAGEANGMGKETSHRDVATQNDVARNPFLLKANSLGSIIGQFKSVATKRIRGAGFSDFGWQPRFYEQIIRNAQALDDIRQYIIDNPTKWERDKDHPQNHR